MIFNPVEPRPQASEMLGKVDPQTFMPRFPKVDFEAVGKKAKLLEFFRLF